MPRSYFAAACLFTGASYRYGDALSLSSRKQFLQKVGVTSQLVFNADDSWGSSFPEGETETLAAKAAELARTRVDQLMRSNKLRGGQLLRLAFHDAIARDDALGVGGADGSILLELDYPENRGLEQAVAALRPIAEEIQVRFGSGASSPACLSWADLIAVAGAQAVETGGGPAIRFPLGRVDATSPTPRDLSKPRGPPKKDKSRATVSRALPEPGLDADGLSIFYARVGLGSPRQIVALSGAHTFGRHVTLLGLENKRSENDLPCLKNLTRACLNEGELVPFVSRNPDRFDNEYFKTLLRWDARSLDRGEALFVPTDVVLVVNGRFRPWVEAYARDEELFFREFASAYQRLVNIGTAKLWN